jgi:hypothetical protein
MAKALMISVLRRKPLSTSRGTQRVTQQPKKRRITVDSDNVVNPVDLDGVCHGYLDAAEFHWSTANENFVALRQNSERPIPVRADAAYTEAADNNYKPKFSRGFTPFRMKLPGRRAKIISAARDAQSHYRL